ncbi:LysM domain-containing protein [Prauserella marina]|uniref:LysM domain-containing protein n=1 Tax=Prauserella marina TaxID=530584 RepID=A0A1G6UUQ9_9PSEU|nr:LysM peptidoglycan-binding domain-containing protein [Prauserella marina]PWV74623.1 LysM domain-containing protein [Prauserella marina]SDD45033.1 LysM domain-containing protein [Prauserella marina]
MSVLMERETRADGTVQRPDTAARPRRGEPRRPPTRARVVAGRPRTRAVLDCSPRTVAPRWTLLIAVAVTVFGAVVGIGLFASGVGGAGEVSVPSGTAVVSVEAGDTLWDVAERTAPGSDPAAVVARIQELNGLGGADVVAGTPLVVPAGR